MIEEEYLTVYTVLQINNNHFKKRMDSQDIQNLSNEDITDIIEAIKSKINFINGMSSSNVEEIYEMYNIDSYIISKEELYEFANKYVNKRINNSKIIKSIFFESFKNHYPTCLECDITLNIPLEDIYNAYNKKQ